MPEYGYRCDECGQDHAINCRMGKAPKAPACPTCGEAMHRIFHPATDLWKNETGQLVRSPGRQWEGGSTFDPVEFRAKNRVNTGRGKQAAK